MANIYDMADTWNAGGTTFTAIKMNVTDTASAAGSLLMDLQVSGASRLTVSKAGLLSSGGQYSSGLALDSASSVSTPEIFSGDTAYSPGSSITVRFTSGYGHNYSKGMWVREALAFASQATRTSFNNPDVALKRYAPGVLTIMNGLEGGAGNNGGASLECIEQAAPSAPSTDRVRIYAEDNGAGKTRLMAKFATGAAQQIAIEP